jgi:septin family protein
VLADGGADAVDENIPRFLQCRTRNLAILLLGRTGSGKTTLSKLLRGKRIGPAAPADPLPDSQVIEVDTGCIVFKGQYMCLQIIDTVGFSDLDRNNSRCERPLSDTSRKN